MVREKTHSLTLTLSLAACERLHHAAGLWGDSALDRFKRRLAWALCDRLRRELAEWERIDAHVPRVEWPRRQPVASARAPERRAAFRVALRLRAAQGELEALARLHWTEDVGEDLPLYRLAAAGAGRLAWIVDPLERALAEVEP